jgi:hypothetical protein
MLTASDQERVHGCRIEGPADTTSVSAIDVVDFDLVDKDGDCLLVAQVKSASPGRQVSAPDAFTILAELVCKVEAEQYELITAALPDRNCRALATILPRPVRRSSGSPTGGPRAATGRAARARAGGPGRRTSSTPSPLSPKAGRWLPRDGCCGTWPSMDCRAAPQGWAVCWCTPLIEAGASPGR